MSADDHVSAREEIIANGLRDVASELRLIDVVEFIAYIRFERFGIIENLIATSTELYFRAGALCFGHGGDLDVEWGEVPVVKLDMEFRHPSVQAQFRLILQGDTGGVELTNITFVENHGNPVKNTEFLRTAVLESRHNQALPSTLLPPSGVIAKADLATL